MPNVFHNLTCVATKLHKPRVSPKTIYYRSYKTFDDEAFINYVQNIPFSVCDVFDDVDDRLWSFNKLLNTLNKTLSQFERIHSQDVVKIIN